MLTASDSDQIFVSTLLDLSAAFDTIAHDILLHRLSRVFGIHETAPLFSDSHMQEREQVVSVHGYASNPHLLYSVLYTHNLTDIDRQSVLHQIHMFADNAESYRSTDRSSINSLFTAMQSCVSDVIG